MKLNIRTLLTFSSLILVGIFSINWSSNPPIDRTNRPGSSGNCTGCHSGSLNPSGGSLTLTGTNSYYPGKTYTITAALTGGTIYGFEMTAVQSSSTSTGAGSFSGTGFNTTTSGGRPYARHSSASTTSSYGVSWKAPTTNVGSVTIYAAGVAANSNGGTSGDKTYATTKTITALNKITFGYDTTSISCFNGSDGKIKLKSITGGAGAPFTFAWSGSTSTADSLTGLSAGNYKVTVTDKDNNSEEKTITLGNPKIITNSFATNSTLCNDSTGWALPTVSGGKSPYTVSWPTNVTVSNDTAINLKAGSYTITVNDANNCSIMDTVIIGTSGTNLTFSMTSNPEFCGNGWGEAMVSNVSNASGNVTYLWSNGKTTATIDSLSAGSYTVTVSDGAGCALSKSVTVGTQSNTITFSTSKTNDACNQGIGTAKAFNPTGGKAPYSYKWGAGQTTDSIGGLIKGTYSVTVTDSLGCSANQSVNVDDENSPVITFAKTNLLCHNDSSGSLIGNVLGGTKPYSYNWSNGIMDSSNTKLIANTNYTLTVTDANGCITVDSSTLTQPSELVVDTLYQNTNNTDTACDEGIILVVSGGTPGYQFSWNTGSTDSILTNLCAGEYKVLIVDAKGCSLNKSITVLDSNVSSVNEKVIASTQIFPNPVNDQLSVISSERIVLVNIYALDGVLVLSNEALDIKSIDVSELNSGSYLLSTIDHNGTQQIVRFMKH